MDAPVEELGAPAEPLGPSGAPDLGSAIHPGQSRRAWPKRSCGRPTFLLARRDAGLTVGPKPLPRLEFLAEYLGWRWGL